MITLKRVIPLMGLMLVIMYLGVHAWTGEQGLLSRYQLDSDIVSTNAALDAIRAQRIALEDRVARLNEAGAHGGIDVDYLEEIVRKELKFAHPDEIVVHIDRNFGPVSP